MSNAKLRTHRRRATAAVCAAVLTTGLGIALTAPQAGAVVPSSPGYTQTAARTYAGGGPAELTPAAATELTVAPDGSVLFYDNTAEQIRRVDASDSTIAVVAGSGKVAAGDIDTTDPGNDVDLPPVRQVWTDSAGDIFAWTCVGQNCEDSSGVDELSAATGRWSVRIVNPTTAISPATDTYDYEGYAVQPDGTVLAVDTQDDVVRRFAPGDQPNGGGTIVAGILQTSGAPAPGVPAPATQTAIAPSGPIVTATDGSFDVAEGRHVDHVDSNGTLTRLPDAGPDPSDSGLRWSVSSLATDGATVYESLSDNSQGEVEAQPVDGDAATSVLTPSGTELDSIGIIGSGGAAQLLAASGEIEQWPVDGSATAGAGQPYAGLETAADGSFQSPDRTRLDAAYISDITALAGAPDGSVAIATEGAIRSLSGLSASSTLGTIATGFTASELHYADDGSLYALVPDPLPHVIRITPDGTQQTVLGGGTQAPAAGVAGPDVLAYELSFAVDPTNRQLYFTDSLDDTVWQVDPSTLNVEPLAQLPNAALFSAANLVVDNDHDVLADASLGHDPRPLTRITTTGDETAAGCIGGPISQLAVLPDGTLIGQNDGASHVCGPDGTDHELAALTTVGPLTSDGRMLRPEDPRTGGLLGYSEPLTAPTPSDTPSATVTTEPGGVAITVTPPAVSGEQISVYGFRVNGKATPVTADFTTDGSGHPVTQHFDDLLRVWPAPADSDAPVWQFEVSAVERDSSTGDQLTDAPDQLTQQLDVDSTAPAAPGLAVTNQGASVQLKVTPPGDSDLDRVVVCRSTQGAVTDPHGCDEVTELSASSDFAPFSTDIDPAVATTFTAFAVDDSGNVSAGTTVTRAAATLVSGSSGVTAIGYGPASSGEEVLWNGGGTAGTRYALGKTAPVDPDAGLEPSNFFFGGTDGHGALIPLSAGATATISIFDWTNASETAFRKVSFTVTQGSTSDSLSLATTSAVDVGSRPTVIAHVTRRSPSGSTTPLPGEYVTVYQRPVGTSTWLMIGSATTTSAGSAAFAVPVLSGATDYQVRHYLDTDPSLQTSSPIVRTSVRQVVSAKMPSRVLLGRTLVVNGSVRPRRAALVDLQRRVGHAWRTVASSHASTVDENYRISYRPPKGRSEFRVFTPATSTLLAGISAAHYVVVS